MTFSKHRKIKTVIQEYSTQPGYKSDMKEKLKAFSGKQQLRKFITCPTRRVERSLLTRNKKAKYPKV